ncbi:MAG: DUF1064 domain-containing protein [bacterium]
MLRMSAKEYNKKYGSLFKEQRGNKYHNKKVEIDDKVFDSQSEGQFYYELKLQERQGLIKGFDTQVKESFYLNGRFICDYFVDFKIYHLDGHTEFLEHKGKATADWRIKFKLLQAKYADDPNVICTVNYYKAKYKYKLK